MRSFGDQNKYPEVDVRGWWNSIPAREFTLKAGPWQKRVRIDPKVTPWHSAKKNSPWSNLSLSAYAPRSNPGIDRSNVVVKRGEVTVQIDISNHGHALVLEDGDVIELTFRKEILEGTDHRWVEPRFLHTDRFVEHGPRLGKRCTHLFQFLGELQGSRDPEFLEGIDYSNIVIQRPEEGKMKEIKVNVLEIAKELLPKGKPEEDFTVLDRDIEFRIGDLIVVSSGQDPVTFAEPDRKPGIVTLFLRAAARERANHEKVDE